MSSNPSENPTEDPQKDTEERYMLVIPLYHVYGILMNLAVTAGGHTLVLLDKFKPETFLGTIQKYKVDHAFLSKSVLLYYSYIGLSGFTLVCCMVSYV